MPYAYDDPWNKRSRKFIQSKVDSGQLNEDSEEQYNIWLFQAWELLGNPHPLDVTLAQLETLEGIWPVRETAKASRCRVVKAFLQKCGNKAAADWVIRSVIHPKQDRVYLTEEQVKQYRAKARRLGPTTELIYSLGVDGSLRARDQAGITLIEGKELLTKGRAVITCKGKHGGKRRLFVMSPMTREPLRAYLIEREALVKEYGHDPGKLLVYEHKGKLCNMRSNHVQYRVKHLSDTVGERFRSHDLRATFGNRMWRNDEDLLTIAAMMGHETPNTTFKHYIGVNQDDQVSAHERLMARGFGNTTEIASQQAEPASIIGEIYN